MGTFIPNNRHVSEMKSLCNLYSTSVYCTGWHHDYSVYLHLILFCSVAFEQHDKLNPSPTVEAVPLGTACLSGFHQNEQTFKSNSRFLQHGAILIYSLARDSF